MLGLESEILIKYKRIIWTPRVLLFRTHSHGENSSYPTMEKAKRIQWGPLDSLSILFALMNRTWVFKNKWYILLFSYLENLYHVKGKGTYERTPDGVHFAVFPIYMPLVNKSWDFNITNVKPRFFQKQVINSSFYENIC